MKHVKLACLIGLAALVFVVTGCASNCPVGRFYTDVKLPVDAEYSQSRATKVGTAECISILSLYTKGDASIQRAMENGNITKVHHVDWDAKNIFGVYGVYKIIVYGE